MKPRNNEMLGDVVFIIAWCSSVQFARKGKARKKKITYRGIVLLLCLPPSVSLPVSRPSPSQTWPADLASCPVPFQ